MALERAEAVEAGAARVTAKGEAARVTVGPGVVLVAEVRAMAAWEGSKEAVAREGAVTAAAVATAAAVKAAVQRAAAKAAVRAVGALVAAVKVAAAKAAAARAAAAKVATGGCNMWRSRTRSASHPTGRLPRCRQSYTRRASQSCVRRRRW